MPITYFSQGKILRPLQDYRPDVLKMMVNYLGVEPEDALKEMEDTRGCHARFGFLESQYTHHLVAHVRLVIC